MFSIPTKHANKLIAWYLVIILLLTLLPLNGNDSKLNHIYIVEIRLDYLAHLALYLPIGFLVRAYLQHRSIASLKLFVLSTIASLVFASGMEYVQFFTTWWSFNINDLIANNMGVLLGYLLLIVI